MRVIETVSEDLIVAEFLRAEINSPRWQKYILPPLARDGRSRDIVDNPNVGCASDNMYRATLLAYRGYRNQFIFSGLPKNVRWLSVSMDQKDLKVTKVMNRSPWPEFTGGTRLAGDAANRFKSGTIADPVAKDIALTATSLSQGNALPSIIMLGKDISQARVIFEGHVRSMAILTSGGPEEFIAFLGISPEMQNWSFY